MTEAISEPCGTHQKLPFLNLVSSAVLEEKSHSWKLPGEKPYLKVRGAGVTREMNSFGPGQRPGVGTRAPCLRVSDAC